MPWGTALACKPLARIAAHLFTTGDLQLRDDEFEWSQVAGQVGVGPERLLLVRQVHEAETVVARRGAVNGWGRPTADVVVSDEPSCAIAVRVADCAPILLADARTGAVAAVHAGWRGTVRSAARAGVDGLRREFGSEPRDIVAAIGPCLGSCCGEVGEEVVQAFRDAGHSGSEVGRWFSTGISGRPYLDLSGANRDQLILAGVPAKNIHEAGLCTRTHADLLHSYRARRDEAGRMAGVIRAR